MSAKALSTSVLEYPARGNQYPFDLSTSIKNVSKTAPNRMQHPTTVYLEPLTVNLVPDVLTNPVIVEGADVVVDDTVVMRVVVGVTVVVAVPGRH
jgi:hypothetical protein